VSNPLSEVQEMIEAMIRDDKRGMIVVYVDEYKEVKHDSHGHSAPGMAIFASLHPLEIVGVMEMAKSKIMRDRMLTVDVNQEREL
jgi:hypothetical protein